jgi:formylglycine-generating enzyme required for sulfatase activity
MKKVRKIAGAGIALLTALCVMTLCVTACVTWASSDPAKATVNADGQVSGAITVTPPVAVTEVGLDKTTLSVGVGGTETLIATVAPADAANKAVRWTSSAPALATVSETGVVSGIAVGTAMITVRTADGGKTASCAVTVTAPVAIDPFTTPAQYREMARATPNATDSVTITGDSAYYYVPGTTNRPDDYSEGVFIENRTVILSPFKIAKYETTYELWHEVYQWAINAARGANVYTFANPGRQGGDKPNTTSPVGTNKHPVTEINWRDAAVWCNAYSEMSGKEPVYYTDNSYTTVLRVSTNEKGISRGGGINTVADKAVMKSGAKGYRLPTEAEWEYAARGGGTPATNETFAYTYAGTDDESDLENYAWYVKNAENVTHPVGLIWANRLGLHDMSGNVWEWCWDWYGTIDTGEATNPSDSSGNKYRIMRGGSWVHRASCSAAAFRYFNHPDTGFPDLGFRVVCRD